MSFKLRPFLLSSILSIAGLFFPAAIRGQFTYTSPQTVTSQPFGAGFTACTGSLQIGVVQNIGQAAHYVAYTSASTPSSISVQMLGSYDGVNFAAISDAATYSGATSPLAFGQVQASGYYPVMAVGVTCPAGSFRINYTGTSVSPAPPAGVGLFTQIIKRIIGGGIDGTSSAFNTLQTPFGSSSGMLIFSPAGGAPPAGGSLVVNCDNDTAGNAASFTFPLASTLVTQSFSVPAVPCLVPIINYNSGGASANTYSLFYSFTPPGLPTAVDPCQNPAVAKSSVPVNVSTATTTQLVALSVSSTIYPCGYSFTAATGTGATYLFEYGTGASCGTGTTPLTGAQIGPNGLVEYGPGSTIFQIPVGNALCLVTGGTSPSAQGSLTFVKF